MALDPSPAPTWVHVFLGFPLLLVGYFSVVVGSATAAGYEYRPKHDDVLYLPFIVIASAAFYISDVTSVPIAVDGWFVVFLPLGVAMYALDIFVWSWWVGVPIERGTDETVWKLPIVFGAIGEEYLYRGVLAVLIASLGTIWYVVLSGVLFGINHFSKGRSEIVFKSVNGIVYALCFLATGSLLAPILAHVGYNVAYVSFVGGGVRFPTVHG
ncbi:CAAX amino terminal protease family [Halovivax ruber XH-70]|uniref:CAAX amino terminal protease family n=1 Tax=Halovivax ruber (strain DSM 18193 / JCM 13892 / XH-70) TaxID=797302 RepID=L0II04_HALRX|nr:CAAX amino terminal protease family [Halovivax ruber XH-70]